MTPQTLRQKNTERMQTSAAVKQTNLLPSNLARRRIVWSGRTENDWEILIYKNCEHFEACFFRWAIHHEHASGMTIDSLVQRVHQRIERLESGRLKKTGTW
ncbi:MAG: hypothetical protein C5B55_09620 [Blastocatellia bacterium]|nr:MAG: hypothetical protein C5B55_09620 [Blastocatellia bacterium]